MNTPNARRAATAVVVMTTRRYTTSLDQSKAVHADMRHRALLHNFLGPFICESAFGTYIVNRDRHKVSVRTIAEDHIIEDMGCIPNASEFLSLIPEHEMHRFARRSARKVRVD